MWGVADLASDRQFGAPWIPWANAITRLITYGVVAVLAAQVPLLFERDRDTATQDALTGIPNRRAFLQVGTSEIERLKRYGHPLSIVFLDLDNFKQLNDSKGHDAGDDALRATAEALLKALRSSDHVARLGGDEFAAMLLEIGYGAAVEAGRKISYTLHETLRNYPPVRVSIGVAWFERVDQSIDDLLKVADQLMYEVKMSGKGDVRVQRFPPQAEDGHLAAPQVSQLNLAIRAPVNGRLEKT
jgi:diguanylate cyclase (GGDEF)-like protein